MKSEKKSAFFSSCIGCDKPFVKVDLKTGEETPIASQYPVCMGCMQKGTTDKEFWELTKQKIHELANNRHNTTTSRLPKPEKV